MTFAAPMWLLVAPLGWAAVLFLHMRMSSPKVVSSLLIWRRLADTQDVSPRWRWPKPSLLLALQLLIVLAAAIALARPISTDQATSHTLVLLDASSSMSAATSQGDSPYDLALEQLFDSTMHGSWSVVTVAGDVRPVAISFSDPATIEHTVRSVAPAPESGRASWAEAGRFAARLAETHSVTRLWILTDDAKTARDGVVSGWTPSARDSMPHTVVTAFTGAAGNVGLTSLSATETQGDSSRQRGLTGVQNLWQVTAEISVQGAVPDRVEVRLAFRPDGTSSFLAWDATTVRADENAVAAFDVMLPGPGVLRADLAGIEGATLPGWSDDDTFVELISGNEAQITAMVIGPPSSSLLRALDSIDDLSYEVFPAAPDGIPDANLAIVLLPIVEALGVPTWYFGVPPPNASSTLAADSAIGWESTHQITSGLPWRELGSMRVQEVEALPGADILVRGGGGPLVQTWIETDGPVVHTAFGPSAIVDGSSSLLPGLTFATVAWLTSMDWPTDPCRVGVPCSVPPGSVTTDPSEWEYLSPEPTKATPTPWSLVPRRSGTHRVAESNISKEIWALPPSVPDTVSASAPGADSPPLDRRVIELSVWVWGLLISLIVLEAVLAEWRSKVRSDTEDPDYTPRLRWPGRSWTPRLMTLVAVFAAGLALAGHPWAHLSRSATVIVVTDASAEAVEEQDVRLSSNHARLTVVPPPLVATPPVRNPAFAIELASAYVPFEHAGLIVLEPGGPSTTEPATRGLGPALQREVAVSVRPPLPAPLNGIRIAAVHPPTRLRAGAYGEMHVELITSETTIARLRHRTDRATLVDRDIEVPVGRSLVTLPIIENSEGTYRHVVEVDTARSESDDGDTVTVAVDVLPSPRWMVIARDGQTGREFLQALRTQGIEGEAVLPHQAPSHLDSWIGWDGAVLLDVPALELHTRQQAALKAFVADVGGGLLMLGGPSSFGPGGYYLTDLDELSPLSSRVEREAPEVAIMFVLDRSGSMQQAVEGSTRLGVAKGATMAALELLGPESLAGVVAFDEEATMLAPLTSVVDLESFRSRLGPLQPGGGTSIFPGLRLALEQLRESDSSARHVVVMSDGLSQGGDFDALLANPAFEGITVSTVAVGRGADVVRLQQIAERGRGTAHVSEDFRALPAILAQEAMLLSAAPVREQRTDPEWLVRDDPFLDGWPNNLPIIEGWVETTPKDSATVHLTTAEGDPLLASWRFGLGHVIAFTSSPIGTWTSAWQERSDYPRWWAQASRWAARAALPPQPQLGLRLDGDLLRIELSWSVHGDDATGRSLVAIVENEDLSRLLPLAEHEPGRYEAATVVRPGAYEVRVEPAGGGDTIRTANTFASRYAAESYMENDSASWELITSSTGGRVLQADEVIDPPSATGHWMWVRASWPAGVAALAAFLAALALRYAPHLPRRMLRKVLIRPPENAEARAARR